MYTYQISNLKEKYLLLVHTPPLLLSDYVALKMTHTLDTEWQESALQVLN